MGEFGDRIDVQVERLRHDEVVVDERPTELGRVVGVGGYSDSSVEETVQRVLAEVVGYAQSQIDSGHNVRGIWSLAKWANNSVSAAAVKPPSTRSTPQTSMASRM